MHARKLGALAVVFVAAGTRAEGLWLAERFASECKYDMALASWEKASTEERTSFDGRLLKSRILIQLDRGAQAVPELVSLREEAKPNRLAEVLLALGLAQSSAHMFEAAEATLRAAKEKGADGSLVDAAIGETWASKGQPARAEFLLRAVLRRDPQLTGPMLNLAAIRAGEGNVVEAAGLIRLAWQLGYQNPRELRKAPEFSPVRASGLINDLTSTVTGRCATY